jgi:nucleoside-diphosphate-sugar epimerase
MFLGTVGRAAADVAAARGHAVTTVARSSATRAAETATALVGSIFDAALVARALDRADAVLVALGTAPATRGGQDAQVCSGGTRIILAAMQARASRRIVVVSSYGVGPTRSRRPFPFNLVAATLLRDAMADKELQEQDVRASDTDWTIAQPLGLTDDPASGTPYVATDGSHKVTRVPRGDVAAVCIDAIENRRYLRETIAVSASR